MSISEQVKELRGYAYAHEASGDCIQGTANALYEAADTIEALQAKLEKVNTERSEAKKPVFKHGGSVTAVDYTDGHGEIRKDKWAEWVCPTCGWFVGQQYIPRKRNQQKCNFCSRCGQAIDWSE